MDTGFIPAAASPDALGLPYLSLNPPGSFGIPKTGRPAMISFMNLESVLITFDTNSFFPLESDFYPLFANSLMNPQPGISSRSTCF